MSITVETCDTIAVLHLGDDENRFSPTWLESIDTELDAIENNAEALVTTGGGKFYSNGLDVEWLVAHGDQAEAYVARVHALFARILTFPLPTAAAINGHAFGAGAMLAVAHDYRIMRDDRGYFCFPEVDIDIPFTPGMAALIQAKLPPQTALTSMTTGRRYGGPDALAADIVDAVAPASGIVAATTDRLAPITGKNPATLGAIKKTMYAAAVAELAR